MSYIPLATKYRPTRFCDVVGQDIVIKIITRGMQKNRLGHALLFCGTRGVGKTTIARILAKALRCPNADPEPCLKCEYCLNNSTDMDVIEIDAASNTSVDDVREIIESCRYKPSSGKYKIFIIDEVHMLSKSAFNALLKTLEEPPEHVKFFLATTEIYKIPETILSRVLKFDLKSIDSEMIAQYLSSVCNKEGIIADVDALSLIAEAAEGSLRDSLSILDQAINICDDRSLKFSDVKDMLGVCDEACTLELLASVLDSDLPTTIKKYRSIIEAGSSAAEVLASLMDYVYALTCILSNVEIKGQHYNEEREYKLKALSKRTSIPAVTKIWQMLLKGAGELKLTDQADAVLEMLLIRTAYAAQIPDLAEILNNSYEKAPQGDDRTLKNDSFMGINDELSLAEEAVKMFPGASMH